MIEPAASGTMRVAHFVTGCEQADLIDVLMGKGRLEPGVSCPAIDSSGVRSSKAVATPLIMLVQPGPSVATQTPGPAGQLSVRLGHEDGGAFAPAEDELHALAARLLHELDVRIAWIAEQMADAGAGEISAMTPRS